MFPAGFCCATVCGPILRIFVNPVCVARENIAFALDQIKHPFVLNLPSSCLLLALWIAYGVLGSVGVVSFPRDLRGGRCSRNMQVGRQKFRVGALCCLPDILIQPVFATCFSGDAPQQDSVRMRRKKQVAVQATRCLATSSTATAKICSKETRPRDPRGNHPLCCLAPDSVLHRWKADIYQAEVQATRKFKFCEDTHTKAVYELRKFVAKIKEEINS